MNQRAEATEDFTDWYEGLSDEAQEVVLADIELLETEEEALGWPLVAPAVGSRYEAIQELVPVGTGIRILFTRDPRLTMLVGADSPDRGRWEQDCVPRADDLFERLVP